MSNEYEIVSHSHLRYLNIFLVRLVSRTAHIHREIELGMVLDGVLTLHIGTQSYQLERGDIYYVNPMDAHEFLSTGSGAIILSMQIAPKYLEAFLPEIQRIRNLGRAKLREYFSAARYELLSYWFIETAYAYLGQGCDYEYRCFASLAQMFSMLKRDLGAFLSCAEDAADKQKSERLLSITDYIEANFTHKILLEDIAKREGLSMTYLSHLFKDSMGVTFQEYVKEKRFEYACNLIVTTQRKILDISISSGFSDVRYLTELFGQRYGCTPKEFRNSTKAPSKVKIASLESTQYFFTRQDSFLLLTPLRNKLCDGLKQACKMDRCLFID